MKALICACVNEPLCGMMPANIAPRIFDLFANTSAWVVKGPPVLILPAAWQLLFIEQTVVSIGCISVENLGLMPAQEKVIPLPPPVEGSLLLHDTESRITAMIRMMAAVCFIDGKF